MKRYGFIAGMIIAPWVMQTVSGEALPPNPVTAAMVSQEQQLAGLLVQAKTAFLITPRLTDALAGNFAELARRKVSVTVITVKGGVSTKALNTLKSAGVRVGYAPAKFQESAIAATGFIATGGILQGKRGANIIKDRLVADEMIGTFKRMSEHAAWQ